MKINLNKLTPKKMRKIINTLRSQVVFSNKLLGLRSLCRTLAEWMYFKPRSIWYKK